MSGDEITMMEDAFRLFPPKGVGGKSLRQSVPATALIETGEFLDNVQSWPDLLNLPDSVLGPDPLYARSNLGAIISYLNGETFVTLLPGWVLLAYERSFDLGIFGSILSNLDPEGVRSEYMLPSGRSEFKEYFVLLNDDQKRWITDMLWNIENLCIGQFAWQRANVARVRHRWLASIAVAE
jgi:hypothetical protein